MSRANELTQGVSLLCHPMRDMHQRGVAEPSHSPSRWIDAVVSRCLLIQAVDTSSRPPLRRFIHWRHSHFGERPKEVFNAQLRRTRGAEEARGPLDRGHVGNPLEGLCLYGWSLQPSGARR